MPEYKKATYETRTRMRYKQCIVILLTPKRDKEIIFVISSFSKHKRETVCNESLVPWNKKYNFLYVISWQKQGKQSKCNDDYKRITVKPFDKITWYLV